MGQNLHVVIAVPSGEMWHRKFGLSLAMMVIDFMSHIPGCSEQQLRVFCKKGTILPNSRQELVEQAIDIGASHILFVDADQSFPPDTLRRLLAHKVPVVGCNIPIKVFPSTPTARAKTDSPRGELVFSEGKEGLERVWRLGTGVMLIDLRVFKHLPKPWFALTWKDDSGNFEGEDWYLCKILEEAGYFVYVDHTLSMEVGHWGEMNYTHDLILTPKFKEREELNGPLTPELKGHSKEAADEGGKSEIENVQRRGKDVQVVCGA